MPIRTCVGCHERASQDRLLRLVADRSGTIRIEGSRRLPGRGTYVHRDKKCVDEAVGRGGLARALRRRIATMTSDALWAMARASSGDEKES